MMSPAALSFPHSGMPLVEGVGGSILSEDCQDQNQKRKLMMRLLHRIAASLVLPPLEAFVNNPKWGNPQRYDLMIEKVKTGHRDWDVEYHVIPEPPSPIDPGIAELATQVPVRLEALYDGGDPFAETDEAGKPVHQGNGRRDTTTSRKTRASS